MYVYDYTGPTNIASFPLTVFQFFHHKPNSPLVGLIIGNAPQVHQDTQTVWATNTTIMICVAAITLPQATSPIATNFTWLPIKQLHSHITSS